MSLITFIENDEVIISEIDYKNLLEDSRKLQCLKDAGVDNWDGYYYAMKKFRGETDEEDY